MSQDYSVFWGDIHNHNEIGYGKGSLARAIEIAREHLDFFAFTPHGQWFDEANTPEAVHRKHQEGFAVVRRSWGDIRESLNNASEPGRFVAFLGHEWHSSGFGDYHVIYPTGDHSISYFDDIRRLQEYVKAEGAVMIPHHVAYKLGSRGINWDYFDQEASPVVEIFSEHGSSETEWGPWPMVGHSMGPAATTQTVRHALDQGKVFGFTASSDDHFGHPGAYGEGLTAALAEALTRESIFAALKARRTYAVTGDRIALDFTLNGAPMGSVLALMPTGKRQILVSAETEDHLLGAELIKNGQLFRRLLCLPRRVVNEREEDTIECKLRVEWGWGGMESAAVMDWHLCLRLSEGEILAAVPHYQSGPFEEEKRNRVLSREDRAVEWQSHTSRRNAFKGVATNAMVFTIRAPTSGRLLIEVEQPLSARIELTVAEALRGNHVERMGKSFSAETLLLHKAIPLPQLRYEWLVEDDGSSGQARDYYYARLIQNNGQMAWASPIWVGDASYR